MTTPEPRSLAILAREGYSTRGIIAYVGDSFRLLGENFNPLIIFVALLTVLFTLMDIIPPGGVVALLLLSPPLYGGFYRYTLKRLRDEEASSNDLFSGFDRFVPLVLASLLSSIFIIIGLVLCLLPGVYLAVSYLFTLVLVVDRRLNVWPAMELSRQLIGRRWWVFFGIGLIFGLISLAVGAAAVVIALVTGLAGGLEELDSLPLGLNLGVNFVNSVLLVLNAGAIASIYHDVVDSASLEVADRDPSA